MGLLALLVALPSSLWRVLMIYGLLPGTGSFREANEGDEAYVLALTVVELAAALAVLALALGWFRPITRRTPLPWWLPGLVGLLGGTVITWLFTYSMIVGTLGGSRPDRGLVHGAALALMVGAYAPLVLWGPLTLAASVGALARGRNARREPEKGAMPGPAAGLGVHSWGSTSGAPR